MTTNSPSESLTSLTATSPNTAKTLWHSLLFVLGFSLVFVVGWGGTTTIAGQVFSQYKGVLARIGGVVVIVFGLHTLGVLRLRWLSYDTRHQMPARKQGGFLSSALMGVFFAAGWTPCIGTTLGAILTMSLGYDTSTQAMVLASGYALGLGIPFLLLGGMVARSTRILSKFRKYIRPIQITSGILQIAIGLLLLTNSLFYIAIWAQRNGLFVDVQFGGGAPGYLVAVLAGLISFLSPCVLPLVPAYLGYLSGRAVGSQEA